MSVTSPKVYHNNRMIYANLSDHLIMRCQLESGGHRDDDICLLYTINQERRRNTFNQIFYYNSGEENNVAKSEGLKMWVYIL